MTRILSNKNFLRNTLITLYILVVLGLSATARAQMSINPVFGGHEQVQTQVYTGQIVTSDDSRFYLIVSRSESYELLANIDLADYFGQTVQINGYELKHKVGPVLRTASLDPLPEGNKLLGAPPLLVVFEISDVAN